MSCQDKQRALDNCDQKYGTGSNECDGLWMELEECRRKQKQQKAGKRKSRKAGKRKSRKAGKRKSRKSRKSKKVGKKSRKSRK
jgi:hypothetical protein